MNIDITSKVDTDAIIYALQTNLSTNQLIDFALLLGDNLTDCETYYKKLKKICDKYLNE